MISSNKQKLIILVVCIVFLSGSCRLSGQTLVSESSLEKLAKNFEYTLSTGSKYKLVDGRYKQGQSIEDYVSIRVDTLAFGDLNGDGLKEAAVILVSNYGGSGSFYELTTLINGGQALQQTNCLELGDRVQIKKVKISKEKIIIEMLTQGPNDPMCCPSKKVNLIFQFKNGRLYETK